MPNEFVQRRDLQQPYYLKAQTLQALETAGAHDLVERLQHTVSADAWRLLQTEEQAEVVVTDTRLSEEIRLVVQKAATLLEQELDDEHFMASAIHESIRRQIAAEHFEEMARWQKETTNRYGAEVADAVMNRPGAKALESYAKELLRELYFFTKADVRESYLYLPTKFAIELRDIEQELASLETELPKDPSPEIVSSITKNQFRSVGLEIRRKELVHLAQEAERWGSGFLHPTAEEIAGKKAARETEFAEFDAAAADDYPSLSAEPKPSFAQLVSGFPSMNDQDDHDPKRLPTGDVKSAWETHVANMGEASPAECVRRFCMEHAFSAPALQVMHAYLCANPEAKEELVYWTCHRGRLQCICELLSMNTYINVSAPLELTAEQEQRLLAAISDVDVQRMLEQDDVKIRVIFDTVKHAESQSLFLHRFAPGLAALDDNRFHRVNESLESAVDRAADASVSELAAEMYLSNPYLRYFTLSQFLFSRGKRLSAAHKHAIVDRMLSQINVQYETHVRDMQRIIDHPQSYSLGEDDVRRIEQKLKNHRK